MPGIEAVRIVDADGNDIDMAALLGAGGATGLGSGRKVVATLNTALAIAATTTCKVVFLTALTTNKDVIVWGDSSIVYTLATRQGNHMFPNDAKTIAIDNLSKLFINGKAGDGVTFTFTT